ncbi:MAG: hypothetical protein U0414_29480 [Polyangiaceae bacterium]
MSTEENDKKESRPRKVARSASTAAHPGYKPGDPAPASQGDGAEGGSTLSSAPSQGGASEGGSPPSDRRKWDVRAERPAGGAAARPPRGPRPGGPRPGGPRPDGPRRPWRGADPDAPRARPGASGGRATPELPQRGPVDRSSAEFVDRWLTSKPRPPGERPPFKDRPRREGDDRRGPRRDRPDGAGPKPALAAKPAVAPRRPDPVPEKKLPTLSETILVGLPKVAVDKIEKSSSHKPKTAREAITAKVASAPAKPVEKPATKSAEVVIDPKWLAADGATAVQTLLDAGDAAEKLVELWTQANNAAAIVEAAAADNAPSAARKAAKRAINVLRARHVAIPERATRAPAATSSEEEVEEATFTAPDARGTVSFTISKRQGGNRAHISEVIVRDGVGVLQAVATWMSRSQIKEAHQRVTDSSGLPPVPVPPAWVRWRIAEAKKDNAVSKALIPLGLERCKDLVEPVPAEAPEHPIASFEATIGDAPAELKKGLHDEPEFRGWLPDGAAIDELIRKVGQSLNAEESKESAKVEAALKEEMKNAADRYFTPEARALLARRMRDAALSIKHRAGAERAADVLHVVQAIEKAGLITSPPREIEFLVAFFEKGVAFLAQRAGGSLRVPVRQ